MSVQELDILNAIETRGQRGYRCSILDEISEELGTPVGDVTPELARTAKIAVGTLSHP
jgi:hypothetical protein